jgi:tetratricopeptide (TPR) repeat protein
VLQRAIKANPSDARAPYYLGNLLFDWQPDEASRLWESSTSLDPQFAISWRNLAQAYSHKPGDEARNKAIGYLEKAILTGKAYPTHFAELDRLYKSAGAPVAKRLEMLEKNQNLIIKNDEALGDLIGLKTFTGKADEAVTFLKSRIFSIWEGGNAFNTGQAWTDALLVRGLQKYKARKYREALDDFKMAMTPPENLRAAQGMNLRQVQLDYWTACAYDALGEKEKAKQLWTELINSLTNSGRTGSAGASNRNAGSNALIQGEQRYYSALANIKLGNSDAALTAFKELAATKTGQDALQSDNPGDPQFVAARRLPSRDNDALPYYLAGLGYSGLGDRKKATEALTAALAASPDFLSAKIALDFN